MRDDHDPHDPSTPDQSGWGSGPAPAAAPEAAPEPAPAAAGSAISLDATSLMARLDAAGRMVVGGAVAVILIVLLGSVVGAWSISGYALIVLLAAVVAVVIPFVMGGATRLPVPARDLLLGAGVVMAVLAVLNLIEVLLDLDQLDDERGGVIGLVLTVALAVAAVIVEIGASRGRAIAAEMSGAMRQGDRGTKLALAGLALELLGILLMLTISVYALSPGLSTGVTALLLAVLVLVVASGADDGWSLPFSPAWIAVVLAAIAAFTLLDQFDQVGQVNDRVGLDAIDLLAFAAHAIGTLLVLGGAVWAAVERQGLTGGSGAEAPPADAG
jgi:hypothetical protein